jgi:transcriptional regulator with XRE-family HTH domain
MGRGTRIRSVRLPEKLLQIRRAFNETQEEMAGRLGFREITREYISGFELGKREPPLPVLLRLAQLAGVYVDVLIDDDLDLPRHLPARSKSWAVMSATARRKHKRGL